MGGSEPPRFLSGGRSVPLDSFLQGTPARPEGSDRLERGGFLVLYTDGVIERRSRQLDQGMNDLLSEVARRRSDSAASIAGDLIRDLRDTENADDVCALVARLI